MLGNEFINYYSRVSIKDCDSVVVAGSVIPVVVNALTIFVVVAGVVGVVEETKLDGYDDVDETVDVVVSA
jgi:hypothetical protein